MREIPMQRGGTTGAKELQDGYNTVTMAVVSSNSQLLIDPLLCCVVFCCVGSSVVGAVVEKIRRRPALHLNDI